MKKNIVFILIVGLVIVVILLIIMVINTQRKVNLLYQQIASKENIDKSSYNSTSWKIFDLNSPWNKIGYWNGLIPTSRSGNLIKTPSSCAGLEGDSRDTCIFNLAVKHQDVELCKKIIDPVLASGCVEEITQFAINQPQSKKQCYGYKDIKKREQCIINWISWQEPIPSKKVCEDLDEELPNYFSGEELNNISYACWEAYARSAPPQKGLCEIKSKLLSTHQQKEILELCKKHEEALKTIKIDK